MPIGVEPTFIDSAFVNNTVVPISNVDTLVLAANPRRRGLIIQRGTTAGRVFVHFGNTPATVTNGMLFRENAYFFLSQPEVYTGEIRAITVGSNKLLYITEVTV